MQNLYFESLNYTLANEDSEFEYQILENNCNHLVSVVGSGSRLIPLLAKKPKKVTAIDVSKAQINLLQLRLASIKKFNYPDFCFFWDYPNLESFEDLKQDDDVRFQLKRKALFESLPLALEVKSNLSLLFEQHDWNSILYAGKWEQTFIKLSRIVRKLMGENWVKQFFNLKNMNEHQEWMQNRFPKFRWALILALVSNARVFNALLYRGKFPNKNIPMSYLRFYLNAFERLFLQGPARNNYFLQLCFLGKIEYPEGLPFEATRDIFESVKVNVEAIRFEFVCGDVIQNIAALKVKANFVSLSDVASYFTPPQEQMFMNAMLPGLAPNAKVVSRSYLRMPEKVDLGGYDEISRHYQDEINKEAVQMYLLQVFRVKDQLK